MKSILLIVSILVITTIVEAQKCVISGQVKGMKNDTLTIMFLPLKTGEIPIIDKVVCVDGKLNYTLQLTAQMVHLVRISSKKWDKYFSADTFPYYFEMEDINFFLNGGDQIDFLAEPSFNGIYLQVHGTQINEQRNELLKKLYPLHLEFNSACLKYADAKKIQDSIAIKKGIESIEKINSQINSGTIDFILKNPDWEISAEVLMRLPVDSCYKYFGKLSPKVQTSFFGKYAKDVLFALKIGDPAAPFTLPDQKGKLVSLSDLKGKFVVLDFWGSWCGWCVKDISKMRQYYAKYKNKVEFVGIACRDTKESWKIASEKYGLNWINLFSPDEKLTKIYGIGGYPSKIILDPNGLVIAKFIGEGTDFYSELDKLFKN